MNQEGNQPIELFLIHRQTVEVSGLNRTNSYSVSSVVVNRPTMGTTRETITCHVPICRKSIVIAIQSVDESRRSDKKAGILGLVLSIVLGLGLMLIAYFSNLTPVFCFGIIVLGGGCFGSYKLISKKTTDTRSGISIEGTDDGIHELKSALELDELRKRSENSQKEI